MKFCKHRVMDRCRKKGRPCTFSKECFEAEEDRETNADRIRAMSDEEMGTELLPLFEELCEDGIPSTDYMRFWLQQPAEEDT